MNFFPVSDPRCERCGAGVDEHESPLCAFCRRDDRGDDQLLSHDSRGWLESFEIVRRGRGGHFGSGPWTERIEHRVPCGCGCRLAFDPGRPLRVPDPGTEHGRELVRALGGEIDPRLRPAPRDLALADEMRAVGWS